jgi:hypothetical protein
MITHKGIAAVLLCGGIGLAGAAFAQGASGAGEAGQSAGSQSAYGGASGAAANQSSQNAFDPDTLNLGKTATPVKEMNRGNRSRVEANERRITAELNRAAAKMPANHPG